MQRRRLLFAALAVSACLCACGETEASVDTSFPAQISQTGSTALSVDEYQTSYAEKNPKYILEIDGYDSKGVLVEQQINKKTGDLDVGLTGIEEIMSGAKYTVASDGVKSKTLSWSYEYDDNGNVAGKETVVYTKDNGTVQSDSESSQQIYIIYYTYTGDGNRKTETTKTRNIRNAETTVSVTTYNYNEDGSCSGYILFNNQDDITQETKFINNTNGKPVKEKTYSSGGKLIQTVINSYNPDGTLSYTQTQSADGSTESRQEFVYDEQGYLIKSLMYKAKDGKLQKYRAYIYQY